MKADIAALLYLVSGVLFILALKGLASPASSRTGNRNGMVGMTLAILTTLWVAGVSDPLTWALVLSGIDDFDAAAVASFMRATPFTIPEAPTWSTDGNVYVIWEVFRDEAYACSTMNVRPYLLNVPTP